MAERGGQTPTDGSEQTGPGMATAATGLAVNATSAGAEGGTRSAGAQNPQPPLEGGGIGHVDGVARQSKMNKVNARHRSSHALSGITCSYGSGWTHKPRREPGRKRSSGETV